MPKTVFEVESVLDLFREDDILYECDDDAIIQAANAIFEWRGVPECRILDHEEFEMSLIETRTTAVELLNTLKDAEADFSNWYSYYVWEKGCGGSFEIMDESDAADYAREAISEFADDVSEDEPIVEDIINTLELKYEIVSDDDDYDDDDDDDCDDDDDD